MIRLVMLATKVQDDVFLLAGLAFHKEVLGDYIKLRCS